MQNKEKWPNSVDSEKPFYVQIVSEKLRWKLHGAKLWENMILFEKNKVFWEIWS